MTKKSAKPSKEAKVKSTNSKKGETTKDLKEKIKNEEEKYLRFFAEFENYKKRTARERIELFSTASEEVMTSLLPILDDFDRA